MKNKIKNQIFVYGTLVNKGTRDRLGVYPTEIDYTVLKNFRKEGLNVLEDKESEVPGLFFVITDEELKILDGYEGIEYGSYHKLNVQVEVKGKAKDVIVYQITPSK